MFLTLSWSREQASDATRKCDLCVTHCDYDLTPRDLVTPQFTLFRDIKYLRLATREVAGYSILLGCSHWWHGSTRFRTSTMKESVSTQAPKVMQAYMYMMSGYVLTYPQQAAPVQHLECSGHRKVSRVPGYSPRPVHTYRSTSRQGWSS